MVATIKEAIQALKQEGFTFLAYKGEETFCSDGIDPINASIENGPLFTADELYIIERTIDSEASQIAHQLSSLLYKMGSNGELVVKGALGFVERLVKEHEKSFDNLRTISEKCYLRRKCK